ncbi:discoidin domain-containing protein [Isosphaeraceae bacterium EP7]
MRRTTPRKRRPSLEWLETRAVPALVALIDTGVDLSDPADYPYYDFTAAYDANAKQTAAQAGNSVVQDTSLQHGHGSTVADNIIRGILDTKAQPGAGSADVKIMPIRVTAGGSSISPTAIVRGVYWAADHGADVINISIITFNSDMYLVDSSDPHSDSSLSQAIQYAEARGALVVTAPGNNGFGSSQGGQDIDASGAYIMPAWADDSSLNGLGTSPGNVLVAAAVDSLGNLSAPSNYGAVHVDFGALSNSSGATSYSAGYTSGVAGTIAALTPSWSAARRATLLKQTVQPHAQSVGAWSSTGGNLNPAGAVASLNLSTPYADRTALAGGIVTSRGDNGPGEGRASAFDNKASTKWLDFSGVSWLQYQFAGNTSYVIDQYSITSASDTSSYPGRAPKSWSLKGSNDGVSWTTLDTQTNQANTSSLGTRTYSFSNATAYRIYRLDNIASNGDSIIQLAEVRLRGPSSVPVATGVRVDRTAVPDIVVSARGDNGTGEGRAKALDNNASTKWLDFSGSSWLQYQFAGASAYVIDQYTLTSASDTSSYPGRAPKSWSLKGSNDGVSWTTLDTQTNQANTSSLGTRTYSFSNATAYRIYRLDNIASNGDSIIQLAEFRLFGPSDGAQVVIPAGPQPTELSRNKATYASSVEGAGYGANLAVDGNSSTRWSSGQWMQPTKNAWIYVDLGATYKISEVSLIWEAAYAVNYQIQVSNDAQNWTTIRSITGNSSAGYTDQSGLSGSGRYVRIYATAPGPASNYSLYDLKIYGIA